MKKVESIPFKHSSSPMMIYEIASLNIRDVNEAAIGRYGYSREEFCRLTLDELQPGQESLELFNYATRNSSFTGNMGRWQHQNKEGKIFWTDLRVWSLQGNESPEKLLQVEEVEEIKPDKTHVYRDNVPKQLKYQFCNSPLAVLLWDEQMQLQSITDRVEKVCGYSSGELLGKTIWEVISLYGLSGDSGDLTREIRVLAEGQKQRTAFEMQFLAEDGSLKHMRWYNWALIDRNGQLSSVLSMVEDLTQEKKAKQEHEQVELQLKKSLQEKRVLLAEIHHRVKNNLAVISGMLQLQCMQAKSKELNRLLNNSEMRIKSISLVHEKLYKSRNLSKVDFISYAYELAATIKSVYDPDNCIHTQVIGGGARLNINQAVPAALILDEVLLNVFEHGFADGESGTVVINIETKGNQVHIKVRDNGRGLPEGFNQKQRSSMGLVIIETLASQLETNFNLSNNGDGRGTCARFCFKKQIPNNSSNVFTSSLV